MLTLRFFLGLLLAQIFALIIASFFPPMASRENTLLVAFVAVGIAIVISLWFSTISKRSSDQRINDLKERFAKEREKINVNAEKAKTRLMHKTQKEIASQVRRTRNRANIKIGAAVAVAAGAGVLMMLTQFVTLGLLTMTTAGGALGGYLARSRKEELAAPDYKLIEVADSEPPAAMLEVNDASESKHTDETTSQSTTESTTDSIAARMGTSQTDSSEDTQSKASG